MIGHTFRETKKYMSKNFQQSTAAHFSKRNKIISDFWEKSVPTMLWRKNILRKVKLYTLGYSAKVVTTCMNENDNIVKIAILFVSWSGFRT